MLIYKDLYPKTKRIANICEITEKIDGSNLQFFKIEGILYIATRNNILSVVDEKEFIKSKIESSYTGILDFLEKYETWLTENIYEGSSIIGEWTRNERYIDLIEKSRFVMFGKARVELVKETNDFKISNLVYNQSLLKYAFNEQEIPDFINLVPLVETSSEYLTVEKLDELYDEYCKKVNRLVEGFVINYNGEITKYVRLKKGKLKPHHS
ncbi:MAG: RNA ligase family protein [Cetobacterium sp.]